MTTRPLKTGDKIDHPVSEQAESDENWQIRRMRLIY